MNEYASSASSFDRHPFAIPFHTVRSYIAVPRSAMSHPESRTAVSVKGNFREKTVPEGCNSIKDETIFLSAFSQWPAN